MPLDIKQDTQHIKKQIRRPQSGWLEPDNAFVLVSEPLRGLSLSDDVFCDDAWKPSNIQTIKPSGTQLFL